MALFDPPGGGPKIAILGALRCRVRGGWGGSAHYPDPTAQSAPCGRSPCARSERRGPGALPGAFRGTFGVINRNAKNVVFLKLLVKFAAALCEVGEVGCRRSLRDVSHV